MTVAQISARIAAIDREFADPSLDPDRRADLEWQRADETDALVKLEHGGDAARTDTSVRGSDLRARYRRERAAARLNGHRRIRARSAPRARGAGRPRAVARTAARGGDSGDSAESSGRGEPGDQDDEPPPALAEHAEARALRRARAPPERRRRSA